MPEDTLLTVEGAARRLGVRIDSVRRGGRLSYHAAELERFIAELPLVVLS